MQGHWISLWGIYRRLYPPTGGLGKHGIVECKRGRIGGVRIRAKVITLLDLWNATCGDLDFTDPALAVMKKPLKAFADSMSKVVIYRRK